MTYIRAAHISWNFFDGGKMRHYINNTAQHGTALPSLNTNHILDILSVIWRMDYTVNTF